MDYLAKLNPAQREAATYLQGPLLIFAGAGSGKTRVLTFRVAALIDSGVDPYHIIAITFTNKAAKEMRERISAITPMGDQVWVSTFHAACTRILRREAEHLGMEKGFTIYDAADTLRLLKDCIGELNLDDKMYAPRMLQSKISEQKNELVTAQQYEKAVAGSFRESNYADVYRMYQKRLSAANALDFDDIIMRVVQLFTEKPDVLARYQSRFRYVLVDEYQDTNHAQYELVRMLAGHANNICVVGDDDQSIYGWRGADVRNILRFEEDFPGACVVKLEQNYRSSQSILDAANAVISLNSNRADKKLWTDNGKGGPLRVYSARDDRDEGSFVAQEIRRGVMEGASFKDFAVLYRTNAQSRAIEDRLVNAGLPYRIFSGVRFYEHTEIKDMLAYLKIINNAADNLACSRVINVPRRGIGAATIEKVQTFAAANGLSFFDAMRRTEEMPELGRKAVALLHFAEFIIMLGEYAAANSVAALITKIVDDTGYMKMLNDGTPEGDDRVANVRELIDKAVSFEAESEDTSLAKFLEDVALVADIDNYEEGADAIALMTLHSAKGLEFPRVFMVGFEEEMFPTFRAIENGGAQMEEERRLCYVGFTRAREVLYITHAITRWRFGEIKRMRPSRFMDEIPEALTRKVDFFGDRATSAALPAAPRLSTPKPAIPKPFAFRPAPKGEAKCKLGDRVRVARYGEGEVVDIQPAGADYEITISFPTAGRKKFMSNFLQFSGA
jgi:DNA helicase-2/ATP-dependent DNA helicase PcrA